MVLSSQTLTHEDLPLTERLAALMGQRGAQQKAQAELWVAKQWWTAVVSRFVFLLLKGEVLKAQNRAAALIGWNLHLIRRFAWVPMLADSGGPQQEDDLSRHPMNLHPQIDRARKVQLPFLRPLPSQAHGWGLHSSLR